MNFAQLEVPKITNCNHKGRRHNDCPMCHKFIEGQSYERWRISGYIAELSRVSEDVGDKRGAETLSALAQLIHSHLTHH